MYGDTVGLKVDSSVSIAGCVQVIRQYDKSAVGIIRDRIIRHDYLLVCSYTDRMGLKRIIQCCRDLVSAGIVPEVYEFDDEPTTIEFLERLDSTYDGISDDIDAGEPEDSSS